MDTKASQITSMTIVCAAVYSGADQKKHQNSASLAFVRGIHRWPVNSPHKGPVTRKMFPFDDVIMIILARFHGELDTLPFKVGILNNYIPMFTTMQPIILLLISNQLNFVNKTVRGL